MTIIDIAEDLKYAVEKTKDIEKLFQGAFLIGYLESFIERLKQKYNG